MATVLVVDDVQSQMELICQAVRSGGWAITQASTGKEALERLKDTQLDLVVLDVIMPDMSGFEVLRRIRKNATTRNLPVVVLTTKDADHDKAWGLDMGANAYVTKPFEPSHLVDVIRKLV